MAYTFDSLRIVGYRDEFVPNTFLRQGGAADHVAIVLPGSAYTCHMPLLYYSTQVLLGLGADVLWVEYAHGRRPEFQGAWREEHERWFFADVTAAFRAALAQRAYGRTTLVGKSLGTLAMGFLLTTEALSTHVDAVWLTPLFTNPGLHAQIREIRLPSLFIIGTADPQYDPVYLADLERGDGRRVVVVEGAGHSLEIDGDWLQTLRTMERVLRHVEAFIKHRPSPE